MIVGWMKKTKYKLRDIFGNGFYDETLNIRLKNFLTGMFLVAGILCFVMQYHKCFLGFLAAMSLSLVGMWTNGRKYSRLVDICITIGNTLIVTGIFLFGREVAPMSFFFVVIMAVASLLILGSRIGTWFSVYYFILTWLVCWTPFLPMTRALYSVTYLRRMPLLLLGFIGIAYIICYNIQKYDWNHKRYKTQLEKRIALEQDKLGDMSLRLVTTMFRAESIKAPEITRHCERVAELSSRIAAGMNLPLEIQQRMYYAGLLHDVGKMEIRDVKLDLDQEEQVEMQEEKRRQQSAVQGTYQFHAEQGSIFLKHLQLPKEITDAALYHHERYDGRGLPEGLQGEQIPVSARIVAVADAIVNEQTKGEPMWKVVSILEKSKDTDFDPVIVDMALNVLDS